MGNWISLVCFIRGLEKPCTIRAGLYAVMCVMQPSSQIGVDTIFHCLWQCQLVVPFVAKIFIFLKDQCNIQENIGSLQYIFGFKDNSALNHILLELKKELFYNWDISVDLNLFLGRFVAKIRKIMIIEKGCIKSDTTFDQYVKKWDAFLEIYDFRGPDPNIV